MKTTVFLVSTPEGSAGLAKAGRQQAEKIKRRFLSEKIAMVYTDQDPVAAEAAELAFGSRGFLVKQNEQIKLSDAPEKAQQCVRLMISYNLGKMFVVITNKDFINRLLTALGSEKKVSSSGSVTTVLFTWEKTMKPLDVDDTSHLES